MKTAYMSCLIISLLISATVFPGKTSAATAWNWANPTPQGNYLNASVTDTASGVSVAVGGGGTIYSNPGGTWAPQSSGTSNNLYAATFGGGLYAAVGPVDTIVTSSDGINWSPIAGTDPTQNLYTIAYGSGAFVAAGTNGTLYTSPDGINWTEGAIGSGASSVVTSVAYGAGKFVVLVHLPGNTSIYYSTTGTSWTKETSVSLPPDPPVYLSYNGSIFVAMGLNVATQGGSIMTSPDGQAWTTQAVLAPSNAYPISITASVGTFVVMLQSGNVSSAVTTPIIIETSTDGIHWTTQPANNLPETWSQIIPRQISYTGSLYLAVGASAYFATSPDLVTWTGRSPTTAVTYEHLRGVHWINGQFIAVGDKDTVLTSTDGVTWTNENISVSQPSNLRDIIYGNSRYVAVGSNGIVLTSGNGMSWTASAISPAVPAGTIFQGLVWSGSQFVAVGTGGVIYTSPDGTTWTSQTSSTSDNLWGVAWTGSQFFVASDNSANDGHLIFTSSNGTNWTPVSSFTVPNATSLSLYGIHWNGTELIVAGGAKISSGPLEGLIATSPDGSTWTPFLANSVNDFFSDAILNGSGSNEYAAVTQSTGNIYASADGSTWTPQISTIQNAGMQNLAWNCGIRVATGYAGVILYSTFQPPTASNGSVSTNVNTAVNGQLVACANIQSYQIATQPAHGTVTLTNASTGAFSYMPASGFSGVNSFTFTASNAAGVSSPATETVTVNAPPVAISGSVSTTENTAVAGLLQASGGALNYQIATQPAHGTVTLTNAPIGAFSYMPASGFSGVDSFTFTASNAAGVSSPATETVTVNAPPVAISGSVSTTENTAVAGLLQASGGALNYQIATQPAHGTVTLTNAPIGAFSYMPASGFSGVDSFTFTASNAAGVSSPATESITVSASGGGGGSSGGGSGGGGALGLLSLAVLTGLSLKHKRRRTV